MALRSKIAACVCLTLLAVAAAATAEREPTTALKPPVSPPAIKYVLGPDAQYLQGCFAPCMCPIRLASRFDGSFGLTRLPGGDPGFQVFRVTGLTWLVTLGTHEYDLTGSGFYLRGEEAGEHIHQLILDLTFSYAPDVEAIRFDSGLVAGGDPDSYPPMIDISINAYGLRCYDTLIDVVAGPKDSVFAEPQDAGAPAGR